MAENIKLVFESNLSQIDAERRKLAAAFKRDFADLESQIKQAFAGGITGDNSAEIDKLNKALATAKRRLKEFEDGAKSAPDPLTDGAKEASSSVKELRTRLKDARTALEALDRSDPEFDKQAAEVRGLNRQLTEYRRSVSGSNRTVDAAADSVNGLRQRVKDLTREYDNLGREQREAFAGKNIQSQIKATTDQLKTLEGQTGRNQRNVGNYADALKGLGGSFARVGKLAAGLGLAVVASEFADLARAAVQFGSEAIAAFQAFETSVREVKTLLPTLSDGAFDALIGDVRDLGVEIGRTTEDTIPALYQALSAGVPPENVVQFLRTASDAAKGGVTDLTTSVDTLTSVVNAYGSEVISVEEASDAIFTAVRLGKTTFEEIGASISKVTPLASSLGVSFDDVSAAIAVLTAGGTPTAQAVTQISAALGELAKPTTKVSQLFTQLTGQSFRQFIDGGGDLQQALAIIADGAEDAGVELAGVFGRKEGLLATLALAGDNADKFAGALDEVRKASGATNSAAGEFSDTLQGAENRASSASEAMRLAVGESLEPYKKEWLEIKIAVTEAATEIARASLDNRSLDKLIEDVSAAAKELDGTTVVLGKLEKAYFDSGGALRDQQEQIRQATILLQILQSGLTDTSDEAIALAVTYAKSGKSLQDLEQSIATATAAREAETRAAEIERATVKALTGAVDVSAEALAEWSIRTERQLEVMGLLDDATGSAASKTEQLTSVQLRQQQQFETLKAIQTEYTSELEALTTAIADGTISRQQAVDLLAAETGNRFAAAQAISAEINERATLSDSLALTIERNKAAAEAQKQLADIQTLLNEAVGSGAITQQQATEALANGLPTVEAAKMAVDSFAEANRQQAEAARVAAEQFAAFKSNTNSLSGALTDVMFATQLYNEDARQLVKIGDEQITATELLDRTIKGYTASLKELAFQQLFNKAENLAQLEQAFALAVATGQLTQAEVDLRLEQARDVEATKQVTDALVGQQLSTNQAAAALEILASTTNTSAAAAIAQARDLGGASSATDTLRNKTQLLQGDLSTLAGQDYSILYTDNADSAIARADEVKARADAAAGNRTITYNIETNGQPPAAGGGGEGFFHDGGRVRGRKPIVVGDAAGGKLTPFSEVFVPDSSGLVVSNDQLKTAINVIRSGDVEQLSQFVATGLRPTMAPADGQSSMVSAVNAQLRAVPPLTLPAPIYNTSSVTSSSEDNSDHSQHITVYGEQAARVLRNTIDSYEMEAHHRAMGRSPL